MVRELSIVQVGAVVRNIHSLVLSPEGNPIIVRDQRIGVRGAVAMAGTIRRWPNKMYDMSGCVMCCAGTRIVVEAIVDAGAKSVNLAFNEMDAATGELLARYMEDTKGVVVSCSPPSPELLVRLSSLVRGVICHGGLYACPQHIPSSSWAGWMMWPPSFGRGSFGPLPPTNEERKEDRLHQSRMDIVDY